nr:MAG TPA: glycoprotein [Caudoviricetes sp.]
MRRISFPNNLVVTGGGVLLRCPASITERRIL